MRNRKPTGHMLWAILFFFAATFGLSACGDVSNVSGPAPLSPDAKLSNLTVSPGSLQPAFSSDVANYTVDVLTTVTSVTVTATPQDATAAMTINGVATNAGQGRTVTLGAPGSITIIPIVVTAPNGSQNTYIISVNRPASSNNNLSALSVTGQTLDPAFSPATLPYTVNVATNVTSVTVSATKAEPNAVMSGAVSAAAGVATGQATINLNNPGNITTISITVTAPNGSSNIYTISVNRAALGGNNNLSALVVSAGALVPAFAQGIISYAVSNVPNATASTMVTATVADPTATLTINGAAAISGAAFGPIFLAVGQNAIPIVVTAQNGTQNTYIVTVNRVAPGGNNNLSALAVSAGALSPAFSAGTLPYNVAALNTTLNTTVTATVADSTATLTINGSAAISGAAFGPIALAVGANPIPIVVTAQDGTPKTYTVTVTRASAGNNNLSALAVSAGALSPAFSAGTLPYNVAALNTTLNTTVTATVADSTATLTINGSAAISGAAFGPIALAVGANPIPIVVTAQDGTPKTYTVTVTRAAIVLSGNNNLSTLVVSAGALIETFDAGTLNYTVTAPDTTTDTTVTAMVEDPTATLTINGSPATSGVASAPIALLLGPNLAIPIVVTAQDGTLKTYTVTITVN